VSSSAFSTAYSKYDFLGDILNSAQTTGGYTYPFTYTYNLANAMTQMTFPSGRVLPWSYDGANRVASVGGTAKTYASSVQYASQGDISQFTLANGLVEVRGYDPDRQQPIGVTLGTLAQPSSALGLTFSYCVGAPPCTNNGNLQSQTIAALGATQTYGYGSRWVSASSGITLSGLTPTGSGAYNPATNRLTSTFYFGYDNNGNQNFVSPYKIGHDAENRQTSVAVSGNNTAWYTYDGDGRRVTKAIAGGPTKTYIYDAKGDLAAEYSTEPPPSPCLTCYLATDHLGSTRLVTDENGNVVAGHDFLPFGEELITSNRTLALGYVVTDYLNQKFTSKERDIETGFDFFGAGYFHGAQGRWTSPDAPLADRDARVPQRWNLYGYVRNNALKNTDPNGRDCFEGVSSCANYVLGGLMSVVNVVPITATLLNHGTNLLTGSNIPDASTLQPSNTGQAKGIQAANAMMLVAPLVTGPGAVSEMTTCSRRALSHAECGSGSSIPNQVAAGTALTDSNVVQNVMVKTQSGVRTQVDLRAQEAQGARNDLRLASRHKLERWRRVVSIEQTDIVDIIGTDRITGNVILTISDHLDWRDSTAHQMLLQNKLNRYLAFVESGEILEGYPDAKGRPVVFRVVFQFAPDDAGRAFLAKVRPIIESAGFTLRHEVFTGARFN
jgi:RHS repeat-associated protein